MPDATIQHVHVHLSGQDDNLGDSVLRDGLLRALRGRNRRFHVYVGDQSSDYLTGLSLGESDTLHTIRSQWLTAGDARVKPVHVFNAGEINPPPGQFPNMNRAAEMLAVQRAGGAVIAAGVGIKTPSEASAVTFAPAFRDAAIMSWRDTGSQEAAGFGEVNPDWAFMLGTPTSAWPGRDERPLLAVTLRFDRAYPDAEWFHAVRTMAQRTGTRIVTIAQVGRDAPRAVRVAAELGGEYLIAPSLSHAALDAHVRAVFRQSLAIITDRAHGLIMGATEGAYPIGSAADPQKIARLLSTVGLGSLVGRYDELPAFTEQIDAQLATLAPAVDTARERLDQLILRIQAVLGTFAP